MSLGVDAHTRTMQGFRAGKAPRNKGQRCPADPPTVDEIDAEHPHVFAVGDAAAVAGVTRHRDLAAQTAQHAQRHGITAACNLLASLGHGKARAYKHRDLGFAVDLTGRNAVATPLGVRLSGVAAKLAGRAYHLRALQSELRPNT